MKLMVLGIGVFIFGFIFTAAILPLFYMFFQYRGYNTQSYVLSFFAVVGLVLLLVGFFRREG